MKKRLQHNRAKWSKTVPRAALLAAGLCLLCACAAKTAGNGGLRGTRERAAVQSGALQFAPPQEGDLIAEIETGEGVIRAVLFPRQAPLAVENFTALAGEGYYNGSAFHRVVEGFVIQGGAAPLPAGDETAGYGDGDKSVWGHPFKSEYSHELRHYAGALCMAPDGGPDTHLSQFYIAAARPEAMDDGALATLREAGFPEEAVETYRQAGGLPYLDNTDTVFGQVFEGMDVVDAIAGAPCDEAGTPKREVSIKSVRITRYAPPADSSASEAQAAGESGAGESAASG